MHLTTVQRRQLALAGAAALLLLLLVLLFKACGGSDSSGESGADSGNNKKKEKPIELPGGGRRLFPDRRIVAFYGNPRAKELGELGIGTPRQAAKKLHKQAKAYDRKSRPVLPAMELISTMATSAPGPREVYSDRQPFSMIDKYLKAARRENALLILDIQPGHAAWGPEIERLRKYLIQPDVGLALDPEWAVPKGVVPGQEIGSMDADAVNAAAAYLSSIVKEYKLPEKLLLIHRFTDDGVKRDERLRQFPGVQTVVNIDGFGLPAAKIGKYHQLSASLPKMRRGFKLFYKEDTNLMSPRKVMALKPRPDVVVYE